MKDLAARTIFATVSGSYLYGTATSGSDLDIQGIVLPYSKYITGFKKFEQIINPLSTLEGLLWDKINSDNKFNLKFLLAAERNGLEGTLIGIHKFITLALNCNPNMIEILYTPEEFWVRDTVLGKKLRGIRDLFLSKKAKFTFTGYAISQLKRIETHRKWLLDPPQEKPERNTFGLPQKIDPRFKEIQAQVKAQVARWQFQDVGLTAAEADHVNDKLTDYFSNLIRDILDQCANTHSGGHLFKPTRNGMVWGGPDPMDKKTMEHTAIEKIGLDINLSQLFQQEKEYHNALESWQRYQIWLANRNPVRAKLEAKYGYDTKHAMHLIRLLRTGRDILINKTIFPCREYIDAQWLKDIRAGSLSYDELMYETKALQQEIDDLYDKSDLQQKPDIDKVHSTVTEWVEEEIDREHHSGIPFWTGVHRAWKNTKALSFDLANR